jgi:hypothetical protein
VVRPGVAEECPEVRDGWVTIVLAVEEMKTEEDLRIEAHHKSWSELPLFLMVGKWYCFHRLLVVEQEVSFLQLVVVVVAAVVVAVVTTEIAGVESASFRRPRCRRRSCDGRRWRRRFSGDSC